jgi:hypothetical protein
MPAAADCGILRVRGKDGQGIDIGYCRMNGELKLVWKYAVARMSAIAGWASESTKYYKVYLSPGLTGSRDLPVLDALTERVAAYFSLKVPNQAGNFILLSRKDELGAAVPALLNRCNYVDPVTGDIVSSLLEDSHEITHRVFLFNGFPCRALTLMQEGSAEIFNSRPYESEENIALTPGLLRGLLDDAFFYSETKNFSRAAKFCGGALQLLGIERFRELYGASGPDLIPLLEERAGCALEVFLERIMRDTRLPGRHAP